MLNASCHCGAVQIEIDRKPTSLTECTCSICRRYAALWAYCTAKTARVTAPSGVLVAYLCNDRVIDFYHCKICGCLTHYEEIEKSDDGRVVVNARMFPPEEIRDVKVRTFDGADTWKYIDEP